MRAGNLDRRIKLFRRDNTTDNYGEEIITWTEIAETWAEWQPLRASERWDAQQVVAEAAGKFRIRYRTGLTPLHAVEWNGEQYDITGIEEIGRHQGIFLHVKWRDE